MKERNHKYYRRLWEKLNGKTIPEDYHIHHLDNDKTNNDIKNLVCVSPEEHFEIHKKNFEMYGNKRDYFSMTYLQRYLKDKQDFSQYKRPPISERHRQAIIKAHKGKTHPNYLIAHSEETKKKMSEHRQKYGTWNSTKCKDIETGIVYKSFTQAEKATGLIRKTKSFNQRII
jgi:ribosomal protein L37AE/L43A